MSPIFVSLLLNNDELLIQLILYVIPTFYALGRPGSIEARALSFFFSQTGVGL